MPTSPYDGLYWETHLPLALYKSLHDLMGRNVKNPNTPNAYDSAALDRQWLSRPRGASNYKLRHSVYTFADSEDLFTTEGIRTTLGNGNRTRDYGKKIDYSQTGYGAQIARSLDPKIFNWYPVAYNSDAFPLNVGIAAAVDKAVSMILGDSSKIFLIGFGKGAVVASKLYDEFRTGRLMNRRSDLLAIYNFGNPMREAGHTIPGGIDTGGHGIAPANERLVNTEELVWEFAAPGDPISGTGDDIAGEIASLVYSYYDTLVTSAETLYSMALEILASPVFGKLPVLLPFRLAVSSGEVVDVPRLLRTLIREFFSDGGNHDKYQNFYPYANKKINAIEAAIIAIQNTTITNPPAVINSSETEVLTINYRQPVSISEISFDILKKNCYAELWYLDRSSNWIQMLNENSSPLTIRVGHSESIDWYSYSTFTYPIVAKAIQFRIVRVADPYIGEMPYSVGVRNLLVRRNVYNRSSGLQGLDDESDALGNIVSKTIKDWDPAKAIDDSANTFWKSAPQPDPDAVVNFYLDTRDSSGNAQLIDKVYLDPVYAGQSLNLYYSNDGNVVSKKLNPASLTPTLEYQVGSTTGASGNGSTATITLNTSPNLSVGDEVTISGMSPAGYNGVHTLSGVSRTSGTISFTSTTVGAQASAGFVTAKGQANFEWVRGKGLKDTVPTDMDISVYRCPFGVGPMVSQDCWIGVQWTPSFDAFSKKSSIIPISTKGVSKVGTTATVFLSAPPNIAAGEKITISGMVPVGYNDTYTVTAVSNSAPDYSVSFDTSTTGPQTQSGTVVTQNFNPGIKDIVTVATSGNGTTATITLSSNPNVVAGELITVSGVTPAGYNGTYTVTAASTSAPWTVSYARATQGNQTRAGTVSTNAKVKIVGINSPVFGTIYSIYDATTKDLLYSKNADLGSCTFDNTNKVLRIPAAKVPSRCLSSDNIIIYYGTNSPAPTQLDLMQILPENTTGEQWWPRLFYDASSASIVLEMLQPNGLTSLVHSAPLSNLFEANTPVNIVAGWRYLEGASPTVYISARTNRQLPLALLEVTIPNFPTKITFDGKIGFKQWRGTFGAHIIKQESYLASSESFLANPPVYCNPDPILIAPTGTTAPASSLDQAVMAVDWTSQQFAAGGSHSSSYSDKEWTPIWVNYFSEKGFLYLPKTTSMKYLKLEFSQLTAEPYPVYDRGIQVSYMVYPITITQTFKRNGLVGIISNSGIGSVNWLNPSSVNQAVNAVYGRTVQPVQTTLQVGPGSMTNTLPNTNQTKIVEATRTEANSPWIYRRTPPNPYSLAVNFFETVFGKKSQGTKSSVSTKYQDAIEDQTAISRPTSSSQAALPIQGQDWYIFPGQTMRMPANVIDGVTKSEVVTRRDTSRATRIRFITTAVHQYETKTVTLDASIAYFAGIREVQPYVVTHIDYEDPPEFRFDNYTNGWSPVSIEKLSTGPITAKENPYKVLNSRFNATLNYWSGAGWTWDTSEGYGLSETWQPGTPFMYGAARTIANGTNRSLLSEPIDVEAGAYVNFAAWVVYRDLTYTSGAKIYVDLVGLDIDGTEIVSSIGLGSRMEVKQGTNSTGMPPYFYFSNNQPCSSVAQLGVKAVPLYGSVNLASVNNNIRKVRIRLNVNSSVTAGSVWFDDIDMTPSAGVIGSVEKTITTRAKFSKVSCEFKDSGIKRSDPMWKYLDSDNPRRTILAHYVSTVPDTMPRGTWLDSILSTSWSTLGPWSDSNTQWGTPYSVVAVNYSESIYDKKRVIHFYRKASTSNNSTSQAGICVRQTLNFVPQGMFRICTTFFKEKKTSNAMELRLTRVSGDQTGASSPDEFINGVIHRETLTNLPTGRWHTHQGSWIEIPNSQDQIYKLELTLSGNAEDDIYLNDLWVEIAQVRYHVQLGGGINHEVTALVHEDNCTVGTTEPVTSMRVQIEIHGNNSFLLASRETTIAANETSAIVSMSVSDPTTVSGIDYTFLPSDVGKYIWVENANGARVSLRSVIIGVNEGKAVLAGACSATVNLVRAVFGTSPSVSGQNNSFAYSSSFTPLYLQ